MAQLDFKWANLTVSSPAPDDAAPMDEVVFHFSDTRPPLNISQYGGIQKNPLGLHGSISIHIDGRCVMAYKPIALAEIKAGARCLYTH